MTTNWAFEVLAFYDQTPVKESETTLLPSVGKEKVDLMAAEHIGNPALVA